MGGISSRRATSFMTLMLVKPCWRWPKSRSGITAAFFYGGGLGLWIWWMSLFFFSLMVMGIAGWLSGVSRCCWGIVCKWTGFNGYIGARYGHTTWRASLARGVVVARYRHCGSRDARGLWVIYLEIRGRTFEAMINGEESL